jgi:hypothetical protein
MPDGSDRAVFWPDDRVPGQAALPARFAQATIQRTYIDGVAVGER